MIAAVRYYLALLAHAQRYLPPVLLFLGLLGLLLRQAAAPAMPEFAVTAGALAVVACWLTIAMIDVEEPVQRLISASHSRGLRTVLVGTVGAVLTCCVGLTVVCVVWSLLLHGAPAASAVGPGALVHLACACAGIAVGLPCSRLLVPKVGYSVAAAIVGLVVVLLVRWIPLVHPMLQAMAGGGRVGVAVLLGAPACLAVLAVSMGAVGLLVARRS